MKGSIHFRKDSGWWFVLWYDAKKGRGIPITKYNGDLMWHRKEDYNADEETFLIRRGVSAFRIVERTKSGYTHIVPKHAQFTLPTRGFRPFIFTNPRSRCLGMRYTHRALSSLWKAACAKVGEPPIRLYAGLKHSTASQMVNEWGYSLSDLQEAGDWASMNSVKHYAQTQVAKRKALLEGKIVRLEYRQNESKK